MSREMKALIKSMIKYDLIGGVIFALIISLPFSFELASIFYLGVLIALINFILSGIILEYSIKRKGKVLLILSYTIRIIIILAIATLFITNLHKILAYILGYISHFILLTIYWLRKEKGSD
jgi:ATP synthase protein I